MIFQYSKKRRAVDNPDPGGYKAAPYGSFPQDVISDGWGWDSETARQKREDAVRERSVPKIDSENVIGSLSGILGPSPEERAAEEQRLQEHRQKMHGWTALFNGMRHLANLYYATKGAPGQKYNDPHAQIEQQYQDERKRLAEIHAADRNYYGMLYNIRRQMEADRRTDEEHQAKLDWYRNRDEQNAEKVAIQKFNAEINAAYKNGTLEEKKRMNDIMAEVYAGRISLMEAQERLAKVRAAHVGIGGSGPGNAGTTKTTTTGYDEKGNKVVTTTTRPNGSSGSGGKEQQKERGSLLP